MKKFCILLLLLLSGCGMFKPNVVPEIGTRAWMEQIDCMAGLHTTREQQLTIGSDEWMIVVSRMLSVYDAQGHGPDLGSEEWRGAIHRKAFGNGPPCIRGITYLSDTGERLHATFDRCKKSVTLIRDGETVTLHRAVSASGAKYITNKDEVFWNKGELATYWEAGEIVFQGVEEIDCRTK